MGNSPSSDTNELLHLTRYIQPCSIRNNYCSIHAPTQFSSCSQFSSCLDNFTFLVIASVSSAQALYGPSPPPTPSSRRRPVRREHLWGGAAPWGGGGGGGDVYTHCQHILFPPSLWNRGELFVSSDGSVATQPREFREFDLYYFSLFFFTAAFTSRDSETQGRRWGWW
ncbi:hypothetical protein E2C01_049600 [Portunus trituberculatus]|uniref:Uncharacterized protein n=1 Tax=Portunus trituberculatus TaxID=210409 RepID=A0A5B7GET8_PORTR|nr:hypothetical protein [Portunus trituberculatus]